MEVPPLLFGLVLVLEMLVFGERLRYIKKE